MTPIPLVPQFVLIAVAAAGPALAATADQPSLVKRWDFNTPGNLEGWVTGQGVKDLTVVDGHLHMVTTGPDDFIFGPSVQAPLDGCTVRVAIRCFHSSDTQVYWQTTDYPQYGEQQVMTLNSPGFGSLHQAGALPREKPAPTTQAAPYAVLEFPIGKPADAGRTLTGIRIDACNGAVGDEVDIDYVEIIRMPPLLHAECAFRNHHVAIGTPVDLVVAMRQTGGRKQTLEYSAELPNGGAVTLSTATSQPSARLEMKFDRAGVHQQRVMLTAAGTPRYSLDTSIIVGEQDTLPLTPALRGNRVRLDLIPTADGRAVAACRWMTTDGPASWRLGGWLLPLARLIVQQADGRIVAREPALMAASTSPTALELRGTPSDLPDWHVQLELTIKTVADLEMIDVRATLTGPAGGKLLEFAAPVVCADRDPAGDPMNRYGLFGGLEMIEPGWRSSSDRGVGSKYADRWAPHPFKVTLPAMSIETAGLTTAVFWQPTEAWNGSNTMPTATFASPNFLDGQPNHLMKLSAPSIPDWTDENGSYARRPYVVDNDQSISLHATLYAEPGLATAMVAKRWYQVYGTPLPPPQTHDDRDFYNLVATCYGRTCYYPDKNGWKEHWYFPGEPGNRPPMARLLLAHAAETGEKKWAERTKLSGKHIVDAGPSLLHQFGAEQHIRAVADSAQPDGTWPFRNTDQMRKQTRQFTDGKLDSLGPDGAVELGTCTGAALGILHQAAFGGDSKLIDAGLKALQAMRRFRVPRGAQTWEVPLEIPDIRAAALAVEAYQLGYQLTRDARYLDDAAYWAWAGVPFIYSWKVPTSTTRGSLVAGWTADDQRREPIPLADVYQAGYPQVTPYGTIPVMGTTFYVVNWFGVLVQWCGLEWADKVIELDKDRPDPLLRYIADGVVLSGLQQMADKGPWVGLYPDSWLLDYNIAQVPLIYPHWILACRQAQGRVSRMSESWTRILFDEAGTRRWHVSGWGEPVELGRPGLGPWTATIRFLPGEPNELVLAGVRTPRLILIDNEVLSSNDTVPASEPGWYYDAPHRALLARFVQSESTVRLKIDW